MTESRSLTDKFMLRLPDGMRDRIKAKADENGRSMNAEIVATLEDKYPYRVFDAVELARFLALLPTDNSEKTKRYIDEINESLRRQRLKMVFDNDELVIRSLKE